MDTVNLKKPNDMTDKEYLCYLSGYLEGKFLKQLGACKVITLNEVYDEICSILGIPFNPYYKAEELFGFMYKESN